MSDIDGVCCVCTRMTDACGIVAGNEADALVCRSCAEHVLEAIDAKEQERAAEEARAAAQMAEPVTAEELAFKGLRMAEVFIEHGVRVGFTSLDEMPNTAEDALDTIREAIAKMREVMA